MKRTIIIIILAALCILFLASCSNSNSDKKEETEQIVKLSTDTLIVIAKKITPKFYSNPNYIRVEFTDTTSLVFIDEFSYKNMRYNSPFYLEKLDTCIIERYSNSKYKFIKNLSKEKLYNKYSK